MAQLFTLGGDRLGSGNNQKVAMHNYEMNSFNLEQDFKSSMAPGILYPFIKMVGTTHGTFDIDIDSFVRTLPTQGPLFGSFKLQVDLFSVPFRLYQGVLHNNPIDIGTNMNQVMLPKIEIRTEDGEDAPRVEGSNDYNYQINESALLKYLGISGLGKNISETYTYAERSFNAVPILAYYDIFKCYYSNKQEEDAYVITPGTIISDSAVVKITELISPMFTYNDNYIFGLESFPKNSNASLGFYIEGPIEDTDEILIEIYDSTDTAIDNRTLTFLVANGSATYQYNQETYRTKIQIKLYDWADPGDDTVYSLYINGQTGQTKYTADIHLEPFKLKNIDKMRYALLKHNELNDEFVIGDASDWGESAGEDNTGLPYSALFKRTTQGITWNAFQQNGLVVKTYQSDLFNNWLDTEYIDGPHGISAITAVDTTGGSFTMDTLNLAEKFYELLNRIITAGGTYQDWQDAVYGEGTVRMCETPMYIGGMSAEIMFEEVIATTENKSVDQALGSLGGKGTQVGKKGGSNIHVRLEEPGYIIGIASITPRICYSQGNDWDMTELVTLDDLHKPQLDGIGFQPLMVEQMAWWDTKVDAAKDPVVRSRNSAGKQTAWINYQTAVDKCYGDFAKQDGYAFMVLNRNYEIDPDTGGVKDVTTYIDPAKYNYAFAYSTLSAQNFWVQIHSKVIARRKMGAQQLPNL